MTNFEKYKDEIQKRGAFLFGVKDEKIYNCEDIPCGDCLFSNDSPCVNPKLVWLFKEYQEKPKLSAKAYHLLKSFPDDAEIIIANGFLYVVAGGVMDSMPDCYNFIPELPKELENGERHKVSEILKWEVE